MNARATLLSFALVATLVATYLAPPPAQDELAVPARALPVAGVRTSAPNADPASRRIDLKERTAGDESMPVAMAVPEWLPKPAPAAAAVPATVAPPPAAPAYVAVTPPFRLVGRYLDGDAMAFFLQLNDQNMVVRSGDVIAQAFQVQRMDDNSLTVLHLPTNQEFTMNLGAGK